MKYIPDDKQMEELLKNLLPDASQRLDARLSAAPWTPCAVVRRRFVNATVVAALALVLLIVFTPQGRVLAQDVILRIGNFTISNEPTEAEKHAATLESDTPTSTPDPNRACDECGTVPLLTVAQASLKADFPVYTPEYIPDGYQATTRDVSVSEGVTTVDTSYHIELDPPLHAGQQMRGIISINQTRFNNNASPWQRGVGNVPIVDVMVRGQPGIWLEQIPVTPFQDENGEWDYARWNQLMWVEAGYNFWIQTNMPADMLPLSELLKVAESLAP